MGDGVSGFVESRINTWGFCPTCSLTITKQKTAVNCSPNSALVDGLFFLAFTFINHHKTGHKTAVITNPEACSGVERLPGEKTSLISNKNSTSRSHQVTF